MTIVNKGRQELIWITGGIVLVVLIGIFIKMNFFSSYEVIPSNINASNTQNNLSENTPNTPPTNDIPLANSNDPASSTLPLQTYIKVTNGCDIHFGGECLIAHSGAGTEFPEVAKLRNGQVLKVSDTIEKDGMNWYKITFDEELLFPERVKGAWYVSGEYVEKIEDVGVLTTWDNSYATGTAKKIIVDRTKQTLSAFDGDTLFMKVAVSTGLKNTPTPSGTFDVFKKTPSRYMQGPLPGVPGNQYYDLPGVPWDLYFTQAGAVIHGAYWHDSFGTRYSHGCVNLSPENAEKLYRWADLGTVVDIQN